MTELSGFSAVQPAAKLDPQALQLPTSLVDVCTCESNCGASQILKGLAQIVKKGLTNLIEIDVQAVPTPEGVQVAVIPWDKDGVAKNGVALPGGYLAIDGTKVVGMSPKQHAEWLGIPWEEPAPEPEPTPEPAPEEPTSDPAA
ncbi:hypothetical protein EI067_30770 [Mycobacterium paragordonae]|uniref:hypothetical protein n=1 Tax=Mycobacterium paragordonae TaxID=1389713 RepID=UPI00105C8186|nr:hypothetical protein [Mycobacterium paragordonae]TDK85748.1 hypothetical protein EI067_30770 [Mycobacterium paragordonae]